MDVFIQKFRKNDLINDNGKQIEFSAKQVRDFFEFNADSVMFIFTYKSIYGSNQHNGTQLKLKANKSSERGDYKIYSQTETDKNLKRFLIDDLMLNDRDNIDDFFAIKKNNNSNYEFSVVPAASELGKLCNLQDYSGKILGFSDNENTPSQKIFYGVPGCGKSHTIKKELEKNSIDTKHTKRVVFHPDYTNADFVGQILPILEKDSDGKDTVSYKFTPGPFTQILRSAYSDKNSNYALIIEEINRGNAAAIFGELFQLLDRLDDNETDETDETEGFTYDKGWSSYCVDNDFINAYMRGLYDKTVANDNDKSIKLWNDNIVFNKNTGIRLPPNLSIFATMNTSDQNVFTLDNAFQRRWEMQYIKNELDKDQKKQAEAKIGDTNVTWKDFYSIVNELLVNDMSEQDLSSMEDKQLGVWFVKNKDGKIPLDLFANKVLKYLWDDAFKFNKEIIFNTNEYKSLSQILETATNEDEGISNIFVGDVKNLFMSKINSGIDNANETEER